MDRVQSLLEEVGLYSLRSISMFAFFVLVAAVILWRPFATCNSIAWICKAIWQSPVMLLFRKIVAGMIWIIRMFLPSSRSSASPPIPLYKIVLRCIRSNVRRINPRAQLPRNVDAFVQLRSLRSLDSLRLTCLGNYMYMVCNPAQKEENLSKALLHFLYDRLHNEALSKNFANPDGSFDLLAECPDLAKVPGLHNFPNTFKYIKDIAVREVFMKTNNVDTLSSSQYDLVIELIKVIMIKKAYEDLEGFRASIGKSQLEKLIDHMVQKEFMPSSNDMLKLISRSLSTSVHVLAPGKKVEKSELYHMHTVEKTCTTAAPVTLEPLALYRQDKDSYALARPPK